MLLGGFLQGGVPTEYLKEELKKLPITDSYELRATDVIKSGISAVYVEVLSEKCYNKEFRRNGRINQVIDFFLRRNYNE